MNTSLLSTPEPAQPEWALFKGNLRGLPANLVPSGQSVPDTCPACGAWRRQLPTGLCCHTPGCPHEGQVLPSKVEGPVAIAPLKQLQVEVNAEVKRLSERKNYLSFEEEQELRSCRAQAESLERTIQWLRKQGL